MTRLTKPISRLTAKESKGRQVVVTLAPLQNERDALIGLRLLGTRQEYVIPVSAVWVHAALRHGQREAAARKAARKHQIPWRKARLQFIKENSIPKFTKIETCEVES